MLARARRILEVIFGRDAGPYLEQRIAWICGIAGCCLRPTPITASSEQAVGRRAGLTSLSECCLDEIHSSLQTEHRPVDIIKVAHRLHRSIPIVAYTGLQSEDGRKFCTSVNFAGVTLR